MENDLKQIPFESLIVAIANIQAATEVSIMLQARILAKINDTDMKLEYEMAQQSIKELAAEITQNFINPEG